MTPRERKFKEQFVLLSLLPMPSREVTAPVSGSSFICGDGYTRTVTIARAGFVQLDDNGRLYGHPIKFDGAEQINRAHLTFPKRTRFERWTGSKRELVCQ